MPKFKTLNGLKNYIQRVVEDILQNEVADDVVDKLR
jgi:hypothetical protein